MIGEEKNTKESGREGMVHIILSHSYTMFFFAVILGLVFDIVIPISIFADYIYQQIGAILILLGSILIYWAQHASSCSKEKMAQEESSKRNFACGPYKYSRNPTHIGLTIMTLGLAFVLNSLFSIILVVIASLITKFIFLKKEEILLEKKYGQDYLDYKKKVSAWL